MPQPTLNELLLGLQVAIGPAILISGVGLLLLTMANRLSHIADRIRLLNSESRASLPLEILDRKAAQLGVLWARASLIRTAIGFASSSALLSALLIVVVFLSRLFALNDAWLIGGLFLGAVGALIVALGVFLYDVNCSLQALRLELEGVGQRCVCEPGDR